MPSKRDLHHLVGVGAAVGDGLEHLLGLVELRRGDEQDVLADDAASLVHTAADAVMPQVFLQVSEAKVAGAGCDGHELIHGWAQG